VASSQFTLPAGVTVGNNYTLEVVANGVASGPMKFDLKTSLTDPGFELPVLGSGPSAYEYNPPDTPSGSPWTFPGAGSAGVSGNGSDFTANNPNAPQGSQVAFLQVLGRASESFNLAAGGYTLSFQAAQRGHSDGTTDSQAIEVIFDNTIVGTFTPAGAGYQVFTGSIGAGAPGLHTLTFTGTDPTGGDNTAFVDSVAITPLGAATGAGRGDSAALGQVQVGIVVANPARSTASVQPAGSGQALNGLGAGLNAPVPLTDRQAAVDGLFLHLRSESSQGGTTGNHRLAVQALRGGDGLEEVPWVPLAAE
jgi:hypothetical protein